MKKLRINTASCDVRNVTEGTLSAYDKVEINTANIITSPAAQALMAKYAVGVNTANTTVLPGDVRICDVSGSASIKPGQAVPEEKVFLQVNGSLDIAPGSEDLLRHYAGMIINGSVTCPESISGLLGILQINGSVNAYPDGSIVLKPTVVLDRTFRLRAMPDALYFARKRVVALAPDTGFEQLAEKHVRFATKQLLVSESQAEAAAPLFDERADIVILPDGCAYVDGDAELDEDLLKRYGGKLYVKGDMRIPPESAPLLDQITYLQAGDLWVCRSLKDRVLSKGWTFGELVAVGGTVISCRAQLELNAAALEGAEDGVSVLDCAQVTFTEDVTPELLREKLVSIHDCSLVLCATKEQQSAVEDVATDVAAIQLAGDGGKDGGGDDGGVTTINAASYTLL